MPLLRFMLPLLGNTRWFPNALYAFLMSVTVYLAAWRNFDATTDFLEESLRFGIDDEFDFIVVGAGSAGAVVANRLSTKYNVLLLEAGGEPHPLHLIPLFATSLLNYPEIDWQHHTVPQKNSTLAQLGHRSLLSQGKALGGTSNINYMMTSRGNPKDFDNWAEILGDPDWKYDNLLPFFKKSENYIRKPSEHDDNFDDELHGYGGEIDIQVPPYTGAADIFLEATRELGYKHIDVNGRYTEGFDYTYCPIKFGRRQSTFTSFLEPVRNRPNLTIRKFAFVTKVLFGNDNEAYGVHYNHHRIPRIARARKEVIISAGVNSPKILMLSGIGPKENLEEVGIPVMQNLPVGQSLQDHACTYLGPFFVNESVIFSVDRDMTSYGFKDYLLTGRGPLSNPSCSAFGFLSSDTAKALGQADWPDIQLIYVGASVCKECPHFIAHGFNIQEDILRHYYQNAIGRDGFFQIVSNARPRARGEMKLASSDPYVPAIIDPKYLDNEHDLQVTIEGVKKAIEIAEKTNAFGRYGGQFTDVPFPGCEDVEFRSDDYWACYIKRYTVSLHHIVGTNSMAKSPEFGVVNSKLQVFGTKNLRVIDASVMPVVPVGNTNSPTVMIGEKGADMILQMWENGK